MGSSRKKVGTAAERKSGQGVVSSTKEVTEARGAQSGKERPSASPRVGRF